MMNEQEIIRRVEEAGFHRSGVRVHRQDRIVTRAPFAL